MFRGYVKTVNKECKMSFKNVPDNELLSIEEANKLSEFAGILAENTVLIDIDDYDQSEVLMTIVEDLQLRCRVYQTTRGKHFLFKNVINSEGQYLFNKAVIGSKLACGLTADIKLGCKNGYSILKFKGNDRPIIYDKFEDEDYQEVPKWLLPVKTNVDFANLEDGDGRNDTLWKFILTLQSSGFSKKEARECLTIINKYVMKDSLSEKELNVIMRDGAFKKEIFYSDKVFLFDKFANYLMNAACVRRINGELHIYKEGVYINGNTFIEQEMIRNIPRLKAAYRTEVLKYLDLIVPTVRMCSAYKIAFANGIYDLSTGELKPFDSDVIITNKIPWDYDPNAYSEVTDKTLDKLACNNKEVRMLLEESIGYPMFRRNELRKAFFLTGDKKNGKSTFLQMLNYLYGDENTSNLGLDEIGDKFLTAELSGKLFNNGDDIELEYVTKTGILKKVISGSEFQAQRKGKDPFKLSPFVKLFFSCNGIVRFKDPTGAVNDRCIWIPFDNTFSPDDPDFDPFIISKLLTKESMEYMIVLGLKALKERVLKNNGFTIPEKVKKEIELADETSNPIKLFFKEISIDEIENKPTKDVYLRYSEWCIRENLQALSNISFSKLICKEFNLVTKAKKIDGKTYKIFSKK